MFFQHSSKAESKKGQETMQPCFVVAILLGMMIVCACSNDSNNVTGNGGERKVTYSCRYHNKYAGQDCKEFIGPQWNDPAVREQECGSGFIEEDAKIVAEACPTSLETDGGKLPARCVCHVEVGGPEQYGLYSYEGDLDMLKNACEGMMSGEWEALIEDNAEQDIFKTMPEAFDALDCTDEVIVSSQCKDTSCLTQMIANGETFDFAPVGQAPIAGFVFYPGGNVDPRAYAPSAKALAELGVFVSIVPMADYLAESGYMRADDVRAANPTIKKWFVGGHSMGGTMAARHGLSDSGKTLDGIIIWASIAGHENDMSKSALKVLTIYASLDAGNSPAQVKEYANTLPSDAVYICIDGGDHCQFGYYIDEKASATISRQEQQKQIVQSTADFINDPTAVNSVECSMK